jgi:tetratricopeptide (TPR) repeat protein
MGNLAVSYHAAGRRNEALKLQEQVLPLLRKVNGPEHPETLVAMHNLASSYSDAGRLDEALKLQEQVLPLRRKVNGLEHPDTLAAMRNLAESYCAVGRSQEAIALLEKACDVDAKDTFDALKLATWQTWFGQDTGYEATRRRLVQQAEGTDQAATAARAALAYCLRPSTNLALLTNALNLAQRSVELGKTNPELPWYRLGLGLAEYRNGLYAAAERTLTTAEQKAGEQHELEGTCRLFHALSLFRQGRPEVARTLFSQAGAQTPPLPEDEGKPLLHGKPVSHDVLILWLAFKEAKIVLHQPAAAKP